MNSVSNLDQYLPCGCTAYRNDGKRNTVHSEDCKMNRTMKAHGVPVPQRPAVIAMFTQLNELWYVSHTPGAPQ